MSEPLKASSNRGLFSALVSGDAFTLPFYDAITPYFSAVYTLPLEQPYIAPSRAHI